MKIIILAAAALVATTLSAAADSDDGQDDGVLGTPGWTKKEAVTVIVDGNNVQGLREVLTRNVARQNAAPIVDGVQGTRMPDGSFTGCDDCDEF